MESYFFLDLPDDIISHILCYLSLADIARCSLVSTRMHRCGSDNNLWYNLNRQFGRNPHARFSDLESTQKTGQWKEYFVDSWLSLAWDICYKASSIIVKGPEVIFPQPSWRGCLSEAALSGIQFWALRASPLIQLGIAEESCKAKLSEIPCFTSQSILYHNNSSSIFSLGRDRPVRRVRIRHEAVFGFLFNAFAHTLHIWVDGEPLTSDGSAAVLDIPHGRWYIAAEGNNCSKATFVRGFIPAYALEAWDSAHAAKPMQYRAAGSRMSDVRRVVTAREAAEHQVGAEQAELERRQKHAADVAMAAVAEARLRQPLPRSLDHRPADVFMST
eukprot:TRINITY_DN3082_c0_g1_i1.p1 TRINITY_DN3082_c0_g1~~TRINITY_DN3082_c0_g1_i1.p1  ORF type:complete len:330 (-),score=47.46 TRINITY_DN3082_c0_g1_i1:268-1257(-)